MFEIDGPTFVLFIWLGSMALAIAPQWSVRIGGVLIALGCILGGGDVFDLGRELSAIVLAVLTFIVLCVRTFISLRRRYINHQKAQMKYRA